MDALEDAEAKQRLCPQGTPRLEEKPRRASSLDSTVAKCPQGRVGNAPSEFTGGKKTSACGHPGRLCDSHADRATGHRVPGCHQGARKGHVSTGGGWGTGHLLISWGLKGKDGFGLEMRDGGARVT